MVKGVNLLYPNIVSILLKNPYLDTKVKLQKLSLKTLVKDTKEKYQIIKKITIRLIVDLVSETKQHTIKLYVQSERGNSALLHVLT